MRRRGPAASARPKRRARRLRAAPPLRWTRTAASARAGLRIAQKKPAVMRAISSRLDMNNCVRTCSVGARGGRQGSRHLGPQHGRA